MPPFRICSYFSFFWWWMPSILFWHCFPLRGLASTQALTLIPSVTCSCSSMVTMPVHWWVANSHGMLRAGGRLTRTFQSGHAFPTQGKLWPMRQYIRWPWLCQIFLKRVMPCLFKMTMVHSWCELPGYRADCHLMQPRPAVSRVWNITRSQTLQNGCCETCLNPYIKSLGIQACCLHVQKCLHGVGNLPGQIGYLAWDWVPCSWVGGVCGITDEGYPVACVMI